MTKIEEAKDLLAVVKDLYAAWLRAKEAYDRDTSLRDRLLVTESTVADGVEAVDRRNALFGDCRVASARLWAARKAYFDARHAAVNEWLATQGLPGNDGTWEQRAASEPWLYA